MQYNDKAYHTQIYIAQITVFIPQINDYDNYGGRFPGRAEYDGEMTDLDYQLPEEYPRQRIRPRTTLPPPPEKIINAIKMVDDYLADPKGAIEKEKNKVKGKTVYPSAHFGPLVSISKN